MVGFFQRNVAWMGVLAIASTLGCASSRALTCPGEIASAWKELESPHFRVITDRPLDDARIALADFEETYDVFTNVVLTGEVIEPMPIRVVLFDDEKEYKNFGPRGAAAFFVPNLPLDIEPTPTLVMWGDLVAQARLTFQHELTHHIFRNALGPVPAWLGEGLAEYYSTIRVDGDEVYIGELNPEYEFYLNPSWSIVDTGPFKRYRIPVGDVPRADELIAMDRETFYEQHNQALDGHGNVPIEESKRRTARYAGSWALVHMLTHEPQYGEHWSELLTGLVAGKGYPAAMDEAFGPVMDSIPEAFHKYLIGHHKTAARTKYQRKQRQCPKDEMAAPPARVKTLFAQLRPFRGRVSAENIDVNEVMRSDLDAAVELDQKSPEALLHRGFYRLRLNDFEAAMKDIEDAHGKDPKDPRVALAMARMCLSGPDQAMKSFPFCASNESFMRESVVKFANTPFTHTIAAMLLDMAGQTDPALEQAKRAVKQDPGCSSCLQVLGELLHGRGMIREAIVVQEKALASLPETANGDALIKRIREYRQELIDAAKARNREKGP